MVSRRILLGLLALSPGCAREVTEPAVEPPLSPAAPERLERTPEPVSAAALRDQARARMAAREFAEAAGLFEQACNAGDQAACVSLADLLERGLGVAEDGARAGALYAAACAAGMQSACDKLGH